MPDNTRCTGNIADVMCQQEEEMEFEYKKYYFYSVKNSRYTKSHLQINQTGAAGFNRIKRKG